MNSSSAEYQKSFRVHLHILESTPGFHFLFYLHIWFWSVDSCSAHPLDITALLFLKTVELGVPLPRIRFTQLFRRLVAHRFRSLFKSHF